MANRTTDEKVRSIRPSAKVTDYEPFIVGANLVTNKVSLACPALIEKELEQIELYLSAHFAEAQDPSLKSEKFENASKTYEHGVKFEGILSSQYGQTANAISGGCLLSIDKKKATVAFL